MCKQAISEARLKEIFPSLGFFGGSEFTKIKIPINGECNAIKLGLSSDKDSILNLGKVVVRFKDGSFLSNEDIADVVCSSIKRGSPYDLLLKENFHSNREANPYWQVDFNEKKAVDYIFIYNRADVWGERSKGLEVTATDDFGNKVYSNKISNVEALDALDWVSSIIGFNPLQVSQLGPGVDLEKMRLGYIIPKVSDCLKNTIVSNEAIRWCYWLLPLWTNDDIFEEEIFLVAELLRFISKTRRVKPFDMRCFQKLLSSKERLMRLEVFLNNGARNDEDEVVLTKHGFSKLGGLSRNKEKSLESLKRLFATLEDLGVIPMLAYGTLLGAIRDESFIIHDDDIDVLVDLGASTIEEAEENMEALCASLVECGYKVRSVKNYMNKHVTDQNSGIYVDVFPMSKSEGVTYLHMEKMMIRGVDSNIFNGTSDVYLYGEKFTGPKLPESFLAERYGDSWKTPDRFHEWPWKLKS